MEKLGELRRDSIADIRQAGRIAINSTVNMKDGIVAALFLQGVKVIAQTSAEEEVMYGRIDRVNFSLE